MAEVEWAEEVQSVASHFENQVSAQAVQAIQGTHSRRLLEPLYRSYSAQLTKLARRLEATEAPTNCLKARERIAGAGLRLSRLAAELGRQRSRSEEDYSRLLERRGPKIHRNGRELTKLSAAPSC